VALSLSTVISAIYACAMPISVASPATILETRSIQKEFAIAKKTKLATEVRIENRRIGLLPILSDSLPNRGEEMNCIKAKEATSTPNAVDPTPNVEA